MRVIPECPQFRAITVAGLEYVLDPVRAGWSVEQFFWDAYVRLGLTEATEHTLQAVRDVWPADQPPCPQYQVGDDGAEYRWPLWDSPSQTADEVIALYPDDAADIHATIAWNAADNVRRAAVAAAVGAVRILIRQREDALRQRVAADLFAAGLLAEDALPWRTEDGGGVMRVID